MKGQGPYVDWFGVESAIQQAARRQAADHPGASVGQYLDHIRRDRFLSRVFADPESGWLLKGGTAMLARVPTGRHTRDVDLSTTRATLDEAVEDLAHRVAVDMGDHLRFQLESERPGLAVTQPGVLVARLSFACITDTGKRFDNVAVDLAVGPPPVGHIEHTRPADSPDRPRLISPPYAMFPLTDQLAEKVSTMMTPRPDGRPNSRAKDLVDVDIIAATQYVDLRELRLALAVQQQRANTDLGRHLRVPPHWEPRYQSLATGTSAAAVAPTFADAVDLAARFINPALDAVRTVRTTWGPEAMEWTVGTGSPAAGPHRGV